MSKNNASYKIDHVNGKIEVSKSFNASANVIDSDDYNAMKTLRDDFPSYKIVLKEIKKKSHKKTYANLTYDNMKAYITEQGSKEDLIMYDKIKKLSKIQSAPYSYVKKWFLAKFPEYRDVETLIADSKTSDDGVA